MRALTTALPDRARLFGLLRAQTYYYAQRSQGAENYAGASEGRQADAHRSHDEAVSNIGSFSATVDMVPALGSSEKSQITEY